MLLSTFCLYVSLDLSYKNQEPVINNELKHLAIQAYKKKKNDSSPVQWDIKAKLNQRQKQTQTTSTSVKCNLAAKGYIILV